MVRPATFLLPFAVVSFFLLTAPIARAETGAPRPEKTGKEKESVLSGTQQDAGGPTAAAADDARAEAARPAAEEEDDPGIFAPTLAGLSGLWRLVTSDIGSRHTFRVSLMTETFSGSDFLVQGDTHTRFIGTLAVSYTPWRYIELALNTRSTLNNNERSDPNRIDQPLISAVGDLALGGKGQLPLTRYLSLGGHFLLQFLSSVGGLTFDGDATSFHVGLLASFDLDPLASFPLRFHLNAGYLLDNSDDIADFTNHDLASLLAKKAGWGINRSRVQIRFGTDLFLRRWTSIGITPMVELAVDVATGQEDPDFLTAGFSYPADADLDGRTSLWLTVGVRVSPLRGLNLSLGTDIGLLSPGFYHGSPVMPWNLLAGLSYSYDPVQRVKVVVTEKIIRERPPPAPRPETGRLRGRVLDSQSLSPLQGAIVTFPGKEINGLVTHADGAFASCPLPPGLTMVMATHPGYHPARLQTTLKAGAAGELEIKLDPAPPPAGRINGRVTDQKGAPLPGAQLVITGAEEKTVAVDAGGSYSAEVRSGAYSVTATAPDHLRKRQEVKVEGGAVNVDFTLSKRPRRVLARLTPRGITIHQQVHFATARALIRPDSVQLLDSIVEIFVAHPEMKTVEIGGHTDSRGSVEYNMKLSQARADAVRDYLVQNGVSPSRLATRGYGPRVPRSTNITARGRALNRRVEFNFVEP